MIDLESLTGPGAGWATVAVIAAALALTVARESRGPHARVASIADSHPWSTGAVGAVVVISVTLFVLRLGVLS